MKEITPGVTYRVSGRPGMRVVANEQRQDGTWWCWEESFGWRCFRAERLVEVKQKGRRR